MVKENLKVPKLRFGEFSGAWEKTKLKNKFERVSTKNKNNINQNVLTISGKLGLVNQFEYYNNQYASRDLSNYYLVNKGDFAYNKSYSLGYPYGAIKRLDKYNSGVLSPLYICFRGKNISESFYSQYFESGLFNNNLYKICVEGARNHGLLNVAIEDFFNTTIPTTSLAEQEKIANYLSALDEKLNLLSEKEKNLAQYKKAMMQKLFAQEIRFKDDEGKEFEAWEEKKLGEVISIKGGYAFKSDSFKESGIPIIRISNISSITNVIDNHNLVYYDEVNIADSYKVYKGELLVALSGATTGKACTYNLETYSYVNQRVGVFKSLGKCYYPFITQFVLSHLFSKALVKMLVAGAQPNISTSDLESIEINIPLSIAEQEKIAQFLSAIDEKINAVQKQIAAMQEFKKAMLQQMFV